MSLPNYLMSIKSSGFYRFVWDKSTIPAPQASTMRLLIGYSEKGPFNTAVYIKDQADFIATFGNISKRLENKGVYFHRLALQALTSGPIFALNLKKFTSEDQSAEFVDYITLNPEDFKKSFGFIGGSDDPQIKHTKVVDLYDTNRFWYLNPDKLSQLKSFNSPSRTNEPKLLTIAATGDKGSSCTLFIRKYKPTSYDVTIRDWYVNYGDDMPEYMEAIADNKLNDYFAEVYVFRGEYTPEVCSSKLFSKYFVEKKEVAAQLDFGLDNGLKLAASVLPGTYFFGNPTASDEDKWKIKDSTSYSKYNSSDKKKTVEPADDAATATLGQGWRIPTETEVINWIEKSNIVANFKDGKRANCTYDAAEHKMTGAFIDSEGDIDAESITSFVFTSKTNPEASVELKCAAGGVAYLMTSSVGNADGKFVQFGFNCSDFSCKSNDNRTVKSIILPFYDPSLAPRGRKAAATKASAPVYMINPDYKNVYGESDDALATLAEEPTSNFLYKYQGCLFPYFKNANGNYISLDLIFNADSYTHKMMMKLDENAWENAETPFVITSDAAYNCTPIYLKGYDYKTITKKDSPVSIQNKTLEVLNDKGIREALTNNVDIEYHYIVDTFDSYVDGVSGGCKVQLSQLAKEKDNAFAILNFPAIQKFIDKGAPYLNELGLFDIRKIADNFGIAGEPEGASWCAYFTQLKFSDGTIKSTIPSAGLVSNKFIEKWDSRQPYYIVAGPNYGALSFGGLVGPDYNYSRSDLDVLEPMGINAIIYVPRRGSYINSNQTAKQKPVSALSKINVRELAIYIQNEIEYLMEGYQWELNTQSLRDLLKRKAEYILDNIKDNGGLYKYLVICDESNNTPEIIDNEMVVLGVEIEPSRGSGKMVQTLTIHKTGGLSSVSV